jgi:hypothetical protein
MRKSKRRRGKFDFDRPRSLVKRQLKSEQNKLLRSDTELVCHSLARPKSKAQLDKRDRRLLHKVRVAAEFALRRQARGHSDGWQRLRDALDTADDEMGAMEDFKP